MLARGMVRKCFNKHPEDEPRNAASVWHCCWSLSKKFAHLPFKGEPASRERKREPRYPSLPRLPHPQQTYATNPNTTQFHFELHARCRSLRHPSSPSDEYDGPVSPHRPLPRRRIGGPGALKVPTPDTCILHTRSKISWRIGASVSRNFKIIFRSLLSEILEKRPRGGQIFRKI